MTETLSPSLTGAPADEQPLRSDAGALPAFSAEDVALMMRQIRDARSRIAEEVATCDNLRAKLHEELSMIKEHEQKVTKHDRERVAFLEGQLTAHLLHVRRLDPDVKSIPTPWGRIESRVQPPEYQRNEALVLAWAAGTPFVHTKPLTTLDWKALKEHCHVADGQLRTPEGEVVPGVTVIDRPLTVTVEVFE